MRSLAQRVGAASEVTKPIAPNAATEAPASPSPIPESINSVGSQVSMEYVISDVIANIVTIPHASDE